MIQGAKLTNVLATQNMNGFLGTIVGWAGFDLPGELDEPSNVIPLPDWIWDVASPTVSCRIPCTLLPPPTPILPIQPPPFTTTVSGRPITVTPPSIETPGLDILPIIVAQPDRATVQPVVSPNPVIIVPPVAPDPDDQDNDSGGVLPILPPPIPMPLPPPVPCFQFCGPPFPPIP
jgi:hypothetical protein